MTVTSIDAARGDPAGRCNFPSFRAAPGSPAVAAGETRQVASIGGGVYCAGGTVHSSFTCIDHITITVQTSAGSLATPPSDISVQFSTGCSTFCP